MLAARAAKGISHIPPPGTTARRGLWKDVDRTFTRLGGRRIIGDSFWAWTQKNPNPRNKADEHMVIGYVAGHVDDFNRSGDLSTLKMRLG